MRFVTILSVTCDDGMNRGAGETNQPPLFFAIFPWKCRNMKFHKDIYSERGDGSSEDGLTRYRAGH